MRIRILAIGLVSVIGFSSPAHATSNKTWKDISNYSAGALVVAANLAPALQQDWRGLRQADTSLIVAEGITFGAKSIIHSRRPDNSGNDSFPSGHSTIAFASATTIYKRYGWKYAVPAYSVAALTATARKLANKHRWRDVIVGGMIGTASGWYFTDRYSDKVQLIPWADTHGAGVSLAMVW